MGDSIKAGVSKVQRAEVHGKKGKKDDALLALKEGTTYFNEVMKHNKKECEKLSLERATLREEISKQQDEVNQVFNDINPILLTVNDIYKNLQGVSEHLNLESFFTEDWLKMSRSQNFLTIVNKKELPDAEEIYQTLESFQRAITSENSKINSDSDALISERNALFDSIMLNIQESLANFVKEHEDVIVHVKDVDVLKNMETLLSNFFTSFLKAKHSMQEDGPEDQFMGFANAIAVFKEQIPVKRSAAGQVLDGLKVGLQNLSRNTIPTNKLAIDNNTRTALHQILDKLGDAVAKNQRKYSGSYAELALSKNQISLRAQHLEEIQKLYSEVRLLHTIRIAHDDILLSLQGARESHRDATATYNMAESFLSEIERLKTLPGKERAERQQLFTKIFQQLQTADIKSDVVNAQYFFAQCPEVVCDVLSCNLDASIKTVKAEKKSKGAAFIKDDVVDCIVKTFKTYGITQNKIIEQVEGNPNLIKPLLTDSTTLDKIKEFIMKLLIALHVRSPSNAPTQKTAVRDIVDSWTDKLKTSTQSLPEQSM